ncbi:MAG: CHAT domain-containing protein [Fimbriimonadales bacterium]|nr:CHAT domain-containing protein [Fimbriimonadales bacterium]
MTQLYEGLKEGKSVVEALQAAKAQLRREKPDPLYWAAFVVIGLG